MNSKILIGTSLALITLVGSIALLLSLETYDDSLSTQEINELEKQQLAYPARSTFTGGDMKFLEDWCTNNEGLWRGMGLDRGECMFETRTQYNLASSILDDLHHPKIMGNTAQEICKFLALKCFSNASFEGWYQTNTGKTFVNYDYKGIKYRFDVSDENNITFTMDDSQESFVLSESATLDDEFSINVKTGYDYYQLGEKITINGTVKDNHHILSEPKFEHPVTIQILTDGELVEVAQLDVRKDGQFQYIVKTGGSIWKSGEYQVNVTYDTFTATATFDMDDESRNLLEK